MPPFFYAYKERQKNTHHDRMSFPYHSSVSTLSLTGCCVVLELVSRTLFIGYLLYYYIFLILSMCYRFLSFRTFSQPGLNACTLSHKACIKAIKRRNPSPFCGKIKSVKKTLLNKKRKESSWLIILQILMQ